MTVPEYSRMAHVYDVMMEHVDYAAWAAYIHTLIQQWVPGKMNIMELACGTGTLAIELSALGYRMTCCDRSESMIALARKKSRHLGYRVYFRKADMRKVPAGKSYDAVLCLYDSVNYLTTQEEVLQLMMGVKAVLTAGGVFIFDVCTEKNSLDNFDRRYEKDERGEYTRMSSYLREERIQVNEVRIRHRGRVFTEIHRQKIWPLSEIDAMLEHVGLKRLACLANLTHGNGSEKDERVHFVCGMAA